MCTGTLADINRNPEKVKFLRRTESATNYKILTQNGEMILDKMEKAIFKKNYYPNVDRNYFSRILFLKIWEQLNVTLSRHRPIPFHDAHYEQIVRIIIDLLLDIQILLNFTKIPKKLLLLLLFPKSTTYN
jgi:hypothetical protein